MTKYLDYAILSVAILAILPSCTSTSSEPDEPGSATELKFAAVEDTRASVTTNDKIKNVPFAVYGDMVQTSTSNNPIIVFNGTNVNHNGTKWEYENPQYWFPGHTYSFVALHPANAIPGLDYSGSRLTFSYILPSDYTQTVDILTAAHRRRYATGPADPVVLNFDHIFSRLNFIAKVDPTAQSNIVITRLALINVSMQATYEITPASTTTQTNDFTGGWTNHSTSDKNLFDLNNLDVSIPKEGTHEFFPMSNALLVIPQEVSQDIEVHISYHGTGSDTASKTAIAKLYGLTVTTHGGLWAAGQSYTYTFTLGDNDAIIFNTPSIQDWNEAEGANYVITD